jgi:hypothetical protein
VILTWLFTQALFERSQAKSKFLCREQGTWGRLLEEARRTATAEAWLVEAQQRVAGLSSKMVDLHIWHEEAIADAKEAGEKLLVLLSALARTRKRPKR